MDRRDQIIETMARAIGKEVWLSGGPELSREQVLIAAQAALQALEAGGLVVVPKEDLITFIRQDRACLGPTSIMSAAFPASLLGDQGKGQGSSREPSTSITGATPKSAAPKVGDTKVMNGRVWECYEIELEGAKWIEIGAPHASVDDQINPQGRGAE